MNNKPMNKNRKFWTGVGLATFASASLLTTGCNSHDDNIVEDMANEQITTTNLEKPAMDHSGMNHSMGEGEGEGEGEGATGADPTTDDLAYLTQLGLMRGHLFVGNQLYKEGHVDHAKTHMKHPKMELYAGVVDAFEARNAPGFAEELTALAVTVENDKGQEAVNEAYNNITKAIARSESYVGEASNTVKNKLMLIATLLRVAGEEYGIAVVNGKMENAHEYQDAYGFTQISKQILQTASADNDLEKNAVLDANKILNQLDYLWPGVIPPKTLNTEADILYGAAAKIDLLAATL